MNTNDEKRVEKIKSKILAYSKKKLEYIKANDLNNARICSYMIDLLYKKEKDITEGIERLMIDRKDELQKERIKLESSFREASLLEKMEIKKELYKLDIELQEDNIREYARNKKKEKENQKRKSIVYD